MAWVGPVIEGLGIAGSAGYSAYAQNKGDKKDTPSQMPLRGIPSTTALQNYMARLMALNATNRGPTFDEWLSSGGTARLDLKDTGLRPREAVNLGFVNPDGTAIDYYTQDQYGEPFTDPQRFQHGRERLLARQNTPGGKKWPKTSDEWIAKLWHKKQRLEAMDRTALGPKKQRRVDRQLYKTRTRLNDLLARRQNEWRYEDTDRGWDDIWAE